ncbi:MAG: zinc ribbon domain-containing protein [Schwartzia sp.]|nr:zinc ribbon domain-containing protein [Schwartzia sp. (in: firmicutes)]
MFCTQCGTKLPDNAKFCFSCGAQMVTVAEAAVSINNGTKFVDAKCTNCGAKLEVDPDRTVASCSYCGAEFLVEQAVNNYNISVAGSLHIGKATINLQGDKRNLVARARAFEESNELEDALKYYDRVLDIDFEDADASAGRDRCKMKIDWYRQAVEGENDLLWDEALFYYGLIVDTDEIWGIKNQMAIDKKNLMQNLMDDYVYFNEIIPGFFSDDYLKVKKDRLLVVTSKGEETAYFFDQMSNVKKGLGGR